MYLFFNNKIYPEGTPLVSADSKAFRYGELVFETLRYSNGTIYFFENHWNRLEKAATLLQIQFPAYFTAAVLELHIRKLLEKNKLSTARIRVSLFKGNGGLMEVDPDAFNLLIENYLLADSHYTLNSNGLDLCFYNKMHKPMDAFSNYKTGNHLIYTMAALFAKSQKCNEAIISNCLHRIADCTIANIFLLKNNRLYTPPLQEGAIDGIMRNYLLSKLPDIEEKVLDQEAILTAEEIFLTNTIRGIQWVKRVENSTYGNQTTMDIFNQYLKNFKAG